jgi:choline dehydrogenase-like flavoprotein
MVGLNYDYVIVGAGSAGCVLAARLSEDPGVRVALVEAGSSDDAAEIHLPVAFPQLFKTKFDWDFATEPEPALGRRRIYIPRGKVLGGSSSMNAMIYIRGNPLDFDDWAERGASGWSYRDILPYFIKAEGNDCGDSQFHGRLGPLTVRHSRSTHSLIDRFVSAGIDAGHPRNDDFNGRSQLGVGRYQVTQRDGARCSAAVAYLHPAAKRTNLHIFTDALVTRLQFDGTLATGVSVLRGGTEQTLRAEREIILSAGAFGSPQILMLSGIGPADHLAELGVTPRVDLPVGENLQDHPVVFLSYFTDESTLFGVGSDTDVALYQTQRGPMSSNIGEGGGFMMTRSGLDAPDVQLIASPMMVADEALSAPFDDAFGIGPCVLKPTSRGRICLRSMRPDAKPRIFCNFLSTPEDRETMVAGVRIALEITKQPSLAAVIRSTHLAPDSDTDEDIWSYVQQHAATIYHPTSTCAIGAVVDPTLKVFGTSGLRVVDASVMPSVVRGNTNATVIAIAERAADLMLGRQTSPAMQPNSQGASL